MWGRRDKVSIAAARPRTLRLLVVSLAVQVSLVLPGCGFHLRGTQSTAWPASIPEVRVTRSDGSGAYDPFVIEMQQALRAQAKVAIVETGDVPQLVLYGEREESRVLSVGSDGYVSEYLLRYEASFKFVGADGKELVKPQTVRLLRAYSFDPSNVLAKEREAAELRNAMRRDAVQQIMRRLSSSLAG
jgi:LPS-assembly lipoprotein